MEQWRATGSETGAWHDKPSATGSRRVEGLDPPRRRRACIGEYPKARKESQDFATELLVLLCQAATIVHRRCSPITPTNERVNASPTEADIFMESHGAKPCSRNSRTSDATLS